jgi:hypothetical protein
MCYYRPDNKFPHLVFFGPTDNIDDTRGFSIDSFAYFHHLSKAKPFALPPSWEITAVYPADFQELESFYTHASGGLLLEAADLKAENSDLTTLAAEYRRLDLIRDRHLLALKNDGKLKAVLAVNTANLGLNLSDLTSSLKILVIDSDALTAEILQTAISVIGQQFRRDELPVLLYPVSYADSHGIVYDKIYNMWIFNLQYLDPYFKYINRLLRLSRSVK